MKGRGTLAGHAFEVAVQLQGGAVRDRELTAARARSGRGRAVEQSAAQGEKETGGKGLRAEAADAGWSARRCLSAGPGARPCKLRALPCKYEPAEQRSAQHRRREPRRQVNQRRPQPEGQGQPGYRRNPGVRLPSSAILRILRILRILAARRVPRIEEVALGQIRSALGARLLDEPVTEDLAHA